MASEPLTQGGHDLRPSLLAFLTGQANDLACWL